jgi:DNA polymerase-3 subunit delta
MAKDPSLKRVVLIAAADSDLRKADLKALEKQADADETNVETMLADARPPTEWSASAASVPFFPGRRVVLVRNVLRKNPADEWEQKPKSPDHPFVKELKSLPETALLVLVCDDEPGDDERQARLQTVQRRWEEIVTAAGGAVVASKTDPKDVAERLRKEAKEQGKHMTLGTATLLTEMVGASLTLAMSELEKLVSYVGDNEAIQDSDVRAVVAPEQDYNVFQLVDAIVAGDSGTALKQLRTLASREDKIEGQAFSRIFPTVARQFRLVWQARLCLDADCRVGDPSPQILDMMPSKPRIHEEREWSQQRAARAARKISLAQIRRVFAELVEADARIKGLEPGYSTHETVEQMVLRMAAACRSR